jgi:hypothetical protein
MADCVGVFKRNHTNCETDSSLHSTKEYLCCPPHMSYIYIYICMYVCMYLNYMDTKQSVTTPL